MHTDKRRIRRDNTHTRSQQFSAVVALAAPVMLGYVAIGVPCGILEYQVGLTPAMCFILSASFYTGAGQFMLPNLLMAAVSPLSVIASITFVNMRQILYSASLAPFFKGTNALLSFFFSATVTDESYALNLMRFTSSDTKWSAYDALLLNLLCMSSWACSNVAGALLGSVLSMPVAIASFAMTSIFICLLLTQKHTKATIVTAVAAVAGTALCRLIGLSSLAIFLGASIGLVCGALLGEVCNR